MKNVIKTVGKDVEEYWKKLGPGLTSGAADDDPSGIATYSQAGAQFGFKFIWLSLFTFPLMAVVQEMCARIGLVTGQGLAANIRQHYPRWVLYVCTFLLVAANVFNIGADFGAMAKGAQLLIPDFPFSLLVVIFGIGGLLLQIFTSYAKYARYLKYLAMVLLSYIVSALLIKIDWSTVFINAVVPSFSFTKDHLFMICAILGTTISPYLFFWQTSQEVEEGILRGGVKAMSPDEESQDKRGRIKNMRVDVWSGMFISNAVMFFIITSCAATLFSNGITNIDSAADAAIALRPFAGDFSYALFAIGIIGTGLLAIPILAGSSAYAVSESLGWKFGLYRKLKEAYAFYGVIIAATVVGIGLNFIGLDPIKALIYSAVLNGIISPIIILFIIQISRREDVMGDYKNGTVSSIVGWLTFLLMLVSALGALWAIFGV